MTQEDKAKRYDEAIIRAKSLIGDTIIEESGQHIAEVIFPELKESEDKKIKEWLIRLINTAGYRELDTDKMPCSRKNVIAWLEKQKPINISIEDKRIRKSLINYVYCHGDAGDFTKKEFVAWLEKQGEQPSAIRWYDVSLIPQEMEELLVEWDSEDATWHEIAFYHADTKTFWNGTRQVKNVTRWCYIIDLLEKQGEQKPAENKGMDLVEEEMTPFQKKVFCIVDTAIEEEQGLSNICNELLALAIQEIEQKPAWSEEDERICHAIICDIANDKSICKFEISKSICDEQINWLKSLKERIGG